METFTGIHSQAELSRKYGNDLWVNNAGDRMELVLEKWQGSRFDGDWRILRGSRVLDLGCGTALPESCHVYIPYFCLFSAYNGAEVTGVDIFPPSDEGNAVFRHIQADFVDTVLEGQLEKLFPSDHFFDIIHLWRLWGTRDPFMLDSLNRSRLSVDSFLRLLVPQANVLLSENGLLAAEDQFICKRGDFFVKV